MKNIKSASSFQEQALKKKSGISKCTLLSLHRGEMKQPLSLSVTKSFRLPREYVKGLRLGKMRLKIQMHGVHNSHMPKSTLLEI